MQSVIVDGLWREGDRSLAVRLVAENGETLPRWQPGAHIDVHLPCGVVRQYSLTGACEDDGYLICVGRETASRGGSRYVHETLRPGQKLTISAPRNLFPLQQAERVLLLAAGIGITPLYAMALQLKAAGTPFTLHYYVKHRESAAFVRELSQFGECTIHTDSPRAALAEHLPIAQAGLHAWVCGPAGFMEKARELATAKGWDDAQLHSEAFQPVAPVTSGVAGEIFMVKLASTGDRWPVPADKTIAQVLLENGVAVPLSCEMGICGACLTPVIDGVVDHRDSVQSEAEKNAPEQQVALCCSRSHSGELAIGL
ncbi:MULTISPECIES: PDR/VanB family oxidoreductase [Enterobacter]|uniref:Oxidoreductase n=1 Tax=Enterobacter cloacae TaxID=550 RepID=A0A330GA37_ENTCL|nr:MULTISPECIES: PDR/VanB family oxidoreductase [Enterobacter cloacae complex]MEC5765123.1 PDR/VanB family oxidoreductase [Enterobacter chengduensis]NBC80687.1 2Fe-2S iron-sulfur cluster binding domain-containing protein [Enterobacter asburiae]RAZ65639.1 oxidoreductase [Enterobacter cloacae]HBM9902541.1 oxidoreductase [Enterobacter chengduensis]